MQNQERIDDAETVELFECLARKIMARHIDQRRRFLAKFQKEHGEEVTDRLRLYITKEFNKKVANRKKAEQAAELARKELKQCIKK